MTRVLFKKAAEQFVGFSMKGHAGFAEAGEDIVCSAISAVSLTTLIGMTEVLHVGVQYKMEDGFLSANLEYLSKKDLEKCQILMQTMFMGMQRMELSYGDYIKVEIEEV